MSSLNLDLEGKIDDYPAEDGNAMRLEHRWFAAYRAAARTRAECDALAEVLGLAHDAQRAARWHLSQLEALCDALGKELSCTAVSETPFVPAARERSAA